MKNKVMNHEDILLIYNQPLDIHNRNHNEIYDFIKNYNLPLVSLTNHRLFLYGDRFYSFGFSSNNQGWLLTAIWEKI